MTKARTAATMGSRLNALRNMLEERRGELVAEVHDRMRGVRIDGVIDRDVLDEAESSEANIQHDLGFALIQMKAETLSSVDAALRRIEAGTYGDCFDCGGEIAEARLRALPFALRCRRCEEDREAVERDERGLAQRRAAPREWA